MLRKIEIRKEKENMCNDKVKNQILIKKTLKNNFLSKQFEPTKIKNNKKQFVSLKLHKGCIRDLQFKIWIKIFEKMKLKQF